MGLFIRLEVLELTYDYRISKTGANREVKVMPVDKVLKDAIVVGCGPRS